MLVFRRLQKKYWHIMIYIDRLIVSLDLRWGGCQWAGVIGVCGALGMPEIVGLLDGEFGRDI